jgi:hypothetical protein
MVVSDKERNRISRFQHPPIDFTRRQIRLVRIVQTELDAPVEPTTSDAPIQCEFLLGMVDDAKLPYTALSYMWGTVRQESDVIKIKLHGQDFWVRHNLWLFLRRARADKSLCTKFYWIDALCIDQTENGIYGHHEKNHQVNMMSHIYSNAREVICWLGDPDTNILNVPRDLEALQKYLINRRYREEKEWALSGLLYIMQLKYWSRIWIVQEVILAREATLRCGPFVFSWYDILLFRKKLEIRRGMNRGRYLDSQLDWGESEPIAAWCMEKAVGKRRNIMDALYDFRNHDCSDRRDRIYALLGLFPFTLVEVDYNKSCVELYIEFLSAAPQCGLLFSGPLNPRFSGEKRAQRTKCYFPTALARALRLTDEDKGKVHARLANKQDIDWELVHHSGAECRLKERFERDKIPVTRRGFNGGPPMV